MKPLIILMALLTTIQLAAQDLPDRDLYPFESHYAQLKAGKMHYIDEGQGKVLLFVHGTPTWSFLYRDLIKDLSKDYRCIAIDHLGFGLSEKITAFSGTPQAHAQNLSEFIDQLGLSNITLVVHDFGGPIGLAAGMEHKEKVEKIVLFNSWLWSTKEDPVAKEIDLLLNSQAGEDYYLNQNYSPVVLLRQAFAKPEKLTDNVHAQYIAPFPDPESRQALLKLGRQFVGASDWYESQWQQLDQLADKDWLILWGTQDPFLNTSYLSKWRNKVRNARVVELESGHFVQEEATEASVRAIRQLMKN